MADTAELIALVAWAADHGPAYTPDELLRLLADVKAGRVRLSPRERRLFGSLAMTLRACAAATVRAEAFPRALATTLQGFIAELEAIQPPPDPSCHACGAPIVVGDDVTIYHERCDPPHGTVVELLGHPGKPVSAVCILSGCQHMARQA